MVIPDPGHVPWVSILNRPIDGRPRSAAESTGIHSVTGPRDQVSLTPTSQETDSAVRQAAAIPDIREERVAQLKRRIEEGRYPIQGDRIAVRLMEETMQNNTLLKCIDTKE